MSEERWSGAEEPDKPISRAPSPMAKPLELAARRAEAQSVSGSHRIDRAQKMARRYAPFQVEQIKQLALIARLSTHMANLRRRITRQTESLFAENHEAFFSTIDPKRHALPQI